MEVPTRGESNAKTAYLICSRFVRICGLPELKFRATYKAWNTDVRTFVLLGKWFLFKNSCFIEKVEREARKQLVCGKEMNRGCAGVRQRKTHSPWSASFWMSTQTKKASSGASGLGWSLSSVATEWPWRCRRSVTSTRTCGAWSEQTRQRQEEDGRQGQ